MQTPMIVTMAVSVPIAIPTISPMPSLRLPSTVLVLADAEGDVVWAAVWVDLDEGAASDEGIGTDEVSDGELDILEESEAFSSLSDDVADGDVDWVVEIDTVGEVDKVLLVGFMLAVVDGRVNPIAATSSSTTDRITASKKAQQV